LLIHPFFAKLQLKTEFLEDLNRVSKHLSD